MNKKNTIISFKADEQLAKSLEKIANRSEFIRKAIETALAGTCPFCAGTGQLNEQQQKYMQHFLADHSLQHCRECNGVHFVCQLPPIKDSTTLHS